MTSSSNTMYHRHLDYGTGHILHVDPLTGEVVRRRKMIPPTDRRAAFTAWAALRARSKNLAEDHRKASNAAEALRARKQSISESVDAPNEPQRPKAGRPKLAYANPIASFMHLLACPNPTPWADSIIHGSIVTSAKVSNGRINVKTRAVIGALFLAKITAEACMTSGVSERTAQRIAKAARHAAHGIAAYLHGRPEIRARLEAEIAEDIRCSMAA